MSRTRKKITDLIVYLLARSVIAVLQTFGEDRGERMTHALAWLMARLPIRKRSVDGNLKLIFPHFSATDQVRFRQAMWQHLLLMFLEVAWAPRRLHRSNWRRHVVIPAPDQLLGPLLERYPSVMVTGHFGNFEVAGYVTGLFGLPTMTVARPLDNPYLDRYIAQFRGAKGQLIVPKNGSAPLIDEHLKAGGTLTLLADQDAGPKGCWSDFLGVPASCHKSLALFTLVAGAPLMVVANRRLRRPMQFELDCYGIAHPGSNAEHLQGVRQLTEWYNERLAIGIRRAPEQYWWVHRRWRPKPEPRRIHRAAA